MARFICPNCEYVYDETVGDPREGWPPGTAFDDVDADWTCPDCGVREQVDFVPEAEFTGNDQDGDIISAETRAARAREQAEQDRMGQAQRGAQQ
ncbi:MULTISPECIES: rubredoxin [unclassified Aeromicrobium]|uniref:rubredoxin n=1 Tax=unclassified Aeromicrobium TaxID=2633570 RepID=UPI0009E7B236